MEHKNFLQELLSNRGTHKGQNGKVLIIGGSAKYVGAPALAGLAALRSGADLVTICAPEKVAWSINTHSPDLVTHKLKGEDFQEGHLDEIFNLSEQNDVILIGNGMSEKSYSLIKKFIHDIQKPLVIDATALRVLRFQDAKNSILTPHRDELLSLLKNSGYDELASKVEEESINKDILSELQSIIGSNILLLKGETDYIISKDNIEENTTGNSGMTKGGTGDVLAGLCASLLAQSGKLFESACLAAYVNGKAGDILYKQKGTGFLASDMIEVISKVIL